MVRFQRSIRSARGRGLESREWAKEVTAYINGKHPKSNVQVFSERFGNISTIVWQVDFDDLATLDTFQQSFNTDEAYWALINKGTEYFIENSVADTVYETL